VSYYGPDKMYPDSAVSYYGPDKMYPESVVSYYGPDKMYPDSAVSYYVPGKMYPDSEVSYQVLAKNYLTLCCKPLLAKVSLFLVPSFLLAQNQSTVLSPPNSLSSCI
jgi:hypothetical protein